MTIALEKPRYTPEDLLALPDGERYELVDGELMARKEMGAEAGWVAGELLGRLRNWVVESGAGWVFPSDVGYQCFAAEGDRVRKPDVSFIAAGRLPGDRIPKGHVQIPPDLAVEVVSPNDLFWEVQAKVDEYLRAGVRLVWVVNPETRAALIFRGDGRHSLARAEEALEGEGVLPGFRCPLAELFPPAAEQAAGD